MFSLPRRHMCKQQKRSVIGAKHTAALFLLADTSLILALPVNNAIFLVARFIHLVVVVDQER